MWCEAGHEPDSFWRQTPRFFALAMRAARARNKAKADLATATAYQAAAFNALTKVKSGLKPLRHYLGEALEQKPEDMLAVLRDIGKDTDMRIRHIPAEEVRADG